MIDWQDTYTYKVVLVVGRGNASWQSICEIALRRKMNGINRSRFLIECEIRDEVYFQSRIELIYTGERWDV